MERRWIGLLARRPAQIWTATNTEHCTPVCSCSELLVSHLARSDHSAHDALSRCDWRFRRSGGIGAWGLVDAGAEPVFTFYLGNQVDGELTNGGVNSEHYTGDLVYTNWETTSYWQVKWDGLKLNAIV